MSYTNLISCHVGDAVRADFYALAKSRDMTVASLLRQMIMREIHAPPDFTRGMRDRLIFCVVALDGLLAIHPDTELRGRLISYWQECVKAEDQRDGD